MESNDTTPPDQNHPVWGVYDEFRTARLNVKYLECEIRSLNRFNFWLEVLIAFATSSAVTGFSFWQGAWGGYVWKTIGGVAAILSILKPILKLQDRITRKQELLGRYRRLDHDFNKIVLEVRHRQKYDDAVHQLFVRALEQKAKLVPEDPGSIINERLRIMCRKAVERELPVESFYIPNP